MWKKAVIILLLILIGGGSAAYFFHLRRATYTFYGTEIITTTASSNKLGNILHQTAWELGDCIIKEDGGKRFPSFHQSGRSWKNDAGNIIASRGITEFDDKNGNHCVIEYIFIPGKPTVILLKSDTEESTMALANELMRQFRLFKIEYRE
jgi:hypothetical protein